MAARDGHRGGPERGLHEVDRRALIQAVAGMRERSRRKRRGLLTRTAVSGPLVSERAPSPISLSIDLAMKAASAPVDAGVSTAIASRSSATDADALHSRAQAPLLSLQPCLTPLAGRVSLRCCSLGLCERGGLSASGGSWTEGQC